jgi:hypothetical protein
MPGHKANNYPIYDSGRFRLKRSEKILIFKQLSRFIAVKAVECWRARASLCFKQEAPSTMVDAPIHTKINARYKSRHFGHQKNDRSRDFRRCTMPIDGGFTHHIT